MSAIKLTQPERRIASDVMSGLDEIPTWLEHHIAVYSKMLHQWNLTAAKISASRGAERYKLAQQCAMFAKQVADADKVIRKEREVQQKKRAERDAQHKSQTGTGSLRAFSDLDEAV